MSLARLAMIYCQTLPNSPAHTQLCLHQHHPTPSLLLHQSSLLRKRKEYDEIGWWYVMFVVATQQLALTICKQSIYITLKSTWVVNWFESINIFINILDLNFFQQLKLFVWLNPNQFASFCSLCCNLCDSKTVLNTLWGQSHRPVLWPNQEVALKIMQGVKNGSR